MHEKNDNSSKPFKLQTNRKITDHIRYVEQVTVQIPTGNVIEFAIIFFENYHAKTDDRACVDDCSRFNGYAWVRNPTPNSPLNKDNGLCEHFVIEIS